MAIIEVTYHTEADRRRTEAAFAKAGRRIKWVMFGLIAVMSSLPIAVVLTAA